MTAVARTSTGTTVSGAAGITVLPGAGAAAGNFGIIAVETANQTMSTPSTWTVLNTGAGFGVAAAAGASRLTIFYKQSISAGDVSTGVALADSGDHQIAVFLTYSGVDATTPFVKSGESTSSVATTSASTGSADATKTLNDVCLAIFGTDRDSATVSTNSTGGLGWGRVSNAGGGGGTFIVNDSTATGAGGGLIINEIASLTSVDNSGGANFQCTITSSAWSSLVVVLKAPVASIAGTLSKTLSAVTLSSNGSFTSRIATLAKTLGTATLSSNSQLAISGTLTKTLSVVTLSSASKLAIKGTTAKTLDAVVLTSAAKLKINGTFAKTLGAVTLTANGSHPTGTGAVTASLSPATLSSAGKLLITGSLNKTLGTLVGSEVGHLLISGTLAKTLASATLVSASKLAIKGSLSGTLGPLVGTETGQLHIAGTLNVTLDSSTLAAGGHLPLLPIVGNCSVTLGPLSLVTHTLGFRTSLRRRPPIGEPINTYKAHKYIRNGNGYWTK